MSEANGKLFDRALYRARRERAAANWPAHDFLVREAASRLAERLEDVTRIFPLALDLGCRTGELAQSVSPCRVGKWVGCDLARQMLRCAPFPTVAGDEEWLPFAPDTFDLVTSVLTLHHVNDLPGTLIQIRRCLKPDGLFLAVLPGAETLQELREAVLAASADHGFALSPRVSPFLEVRDGGSLLQRAGFALPVADSDRINVQYDDVLKLMIDLRGMGETNPMLERQRRFTTRAHIAAIEACYRDRFALEDGGLPATFELVTLTGWKPHESQPKPLPRGSGQHSLKGALS